MSPNQSSIEFLNNTGGISITNIVLPQMTALTAWEKILSFDLSGPVYEFFKHIRNASAHNGKFHFYKTVLDLKGELKKVAKWCDLEIKDHMNDMNPIIKNKKDEEAFLDQGDLVEFLLDFENHYPKIIKN
jgi:hypothetical protein